MRILKITVVAIILSSFLMVDICGIGKFRGKNLVTQGVLLISSVDPDLDHTVYLPRENQSAKELTSQVYLPKLLLLSLDATQRKLSQFSRDIRAGYKYSGRLSGRTLISLHCLLTI